MVSPLLLSILSPLPINVSRSFSYKLSVITAGLELAIFVDVDCRIFMLLFLLFASPHSKQLQYLAALPEAVSDFFPIKIFFSSFSEFLYIIQ